MEICESGKCISGCIDSDGDNYGEGSLCLGVDCDDSSNRCNTECVDVDGDNVFDCKDDCLDFDGDGYGVGISCLGEDCDDTPNNQFAKSNHKSCLTCLDKDGDGNFTGCDSYSTDSQKLNYDSNDQKFEGDYDLLVVIPENIKTQIDFDIYTNLLFKENTKVKWIYWTNGDAETLKTLIKTEYESGNIKGAFLIGNLPTVFFEMECDWGEPYGMVYEEWPMDIYFMDINGEWFDNDNNQKFDAHSHIQIEIFTSRLTGTVEEIKSYFQKINRYRLEGSLMESSAFIFKDDDWHDYMASYNWSLDSIYNDITTYEKLEETTKVNYVEFMRNAGAEFVYQWIHSDPDMLYFGENFGGDYLTRQEIASMDLKGSFYNLFDCSASRFTQDNLAKTYIHTSNGLATIGSTKTGGIYNPDRFHGALAEGKNWGEAYKRWYNADGVLDDSWFGGIMIQGDPMLKLNKLTAQKLSASGYRAPTPQEILKLRTKMYSPLNQRKIENFENYKERNPQFFK